MVGQFCKGMNINLIDILVLVALSQGFLFGFVLLFSPFFKATANKYLAFSVILISIIGLNEWLSNWNFDDQYYFIDFFGDDTPWILLFYVPMFLYFVKSTGHSFGSSKWRGFLLLPFLIFLVLNIVINLDVDFGVYQIPRIERFMDIVYTVEFYTALIFSIVLCIAAYWVILRSEMAETDKVWLKRIWIFTSMLILFWLIIVLLPISLFGGNRTLDYALWIAVSCFIYWIIYKGLFQFKLAQDQSAIHAILQSERQPSSEFKQPSATTNTPNFTEDNTYFQNLQQLIEKEHIYRNADLSRDMVAETLGISPGYLSQLVNTVTGDNFTTFVNHYRVEEVKKMLLDPGFDQYSLLAIGMEAGFKSKSAFYTTFKKETGLTPSAFKARNSDSSRK